MRPHLLMVRFMHFSFIDHWLLKNDIISLSLSLYSFHIHIASFNIYSGLNSSLFIIYSVERLWFMVTLNWLVVLVFFKILYFLMVLFDTLQGWSFEMNTRLTWWIYVTYHTVVLTWGIGSFHVTEYFRDRGKRVFCLTVCWVFSFVYELCFIASYFLHRSFVIYIF